MQNTLTHNLHNNQLALIFKGELTLYTISKFQKEIDSVNTKRVSSLLINLNSLTYIDTAGALFLQKLQEKFSIATELIVSDENIIATLDLVKLNTMQIASASTKQRKESFQESFSKKLDNYINGFISFMEFFGKLFMTKIYYLKSLQNIRTKEIAFEINESAIKALGIVGLTSFLIGLVVAYQSAYQLKIYGANIFIVDMLGISILRELAPLMTAIVIAGRSGSAFTAQIGAMKITQELDAMQTMGFNPYAFLVMPRILALMLMMPILIFVSDIMGIFGGMLVSFFDLGITPELFLERFREVVASKHFFIGIAKGPFFAFLIASIGIYRGLVVKDDTQSIGLNTTKSVVESIFAVIVCDALFSIAFTSLGI